MRTPRSVIILPFFWNDFERMVTLFRFSLGTASFATASNWLDSIRLEHMLRTNYGRSNHKQQAIGKKDRKIVLFFQQSSLYRLLLPLAIYYFIVSLCVHLGSSFFIHTFAASQLAGIYSSFSFLVIPSSCCVCMCLLFLLSFFCIFFFFTHVRTSSHCCLCTKNIIASAWCVLLLLLDWFMAMLFFSLHLRLISVSVSVTVFRTQHNTFWMSNMFALSRAHTPTRFQNSCSNLMSSDCVCVCVRTSNTWTVIFCTAIKPTLLLVFCALFCSVLT